MCLSAISCGFNLCCCCIETMSGGLKFLWKYTVGKCFNILGKCFICLACNSEDDGNHIIIPDNDDDDDNNEPINV